MKKRTSKTYSNEGFISVREDPEVINELKSHAAIIGTDASAIVRQLVREWNAKQRKIYAPEEANGKN